MLNPKADALKEAQRLGWRMRAIKECLSVHLRSKLRFGRAAERNQQATARPEPRAEPTKQALVLHPGDMEHGVPCDDRVECPTWVRRPHVAQDEPRAWHGYASELEQARGSIEANECEAAMREIGGDR
jgi:hypothetical protein